MKENGRANANRLDHMIRVIAQAGFRSIQPIYSWMGDLSDPQRLAEHLKASGLELSARTLFTTISKAARLKRTCGRTAAG